MKYRKKWFKCTLAQYVYTYVYIYIHLYAYTLYMYIYIYIYIETYIYIYTHHIHICADVAAGPCHPKLIVLVFKHAPCWIASFEPYKIVDMYGITPQRYRKCAQKSWCLLWTTICSIRMRSTAGLLPELERDSLTGNCFGQKMARAQSLSGFEGLEVWC